MSQNICLTLPRLIKRHPVCASLIAGVIVLFGLREVPSFGSVSLHLHNQPVAEAIKGIEWQGWVRIVAKVDNEAKVNLDLDHVSVQAALTEISRQTHSHWKWAWFVAPNPHEIAQGEESFAQKATPQDNWTVLADPSGHSTTATQSGCLNLQDNLKAIAGHDDIVALVPSHWNPSLAPLDSTGKLPMYSAVPDLATWAGGSSDKVIVMSDDLSF